MDTNQIIDYVMSTPTNTNPAILKSMLNSLGEGSIDFGTMDFNRAGYRYIILDYHERHADDGTNTSYFTINNEPTDNRIIDQYGYKRLNTTEKTRTAVEEMYDASEPYNLIPKFPSSNVIAIIMGVSSEPIVNHVYGNDNEEISFRGSGSFGVCLDKNNTWIQTYEG